MTAIRDRVVDLRRVKASELVPHPENWRSHPKRQRDILADVLAEVGIADAVLAYELADGRLQLVDGHLRADLMADEEIPVLVLDVNDDEARKLLLSIDPLAAMAETSRDKLRELAGSINAETSGMRELLNRMNVRGSKGGGLSDALADKAPARTKLGDLWELGPHRLVCGDATDPSVLAAVMGDDRAECVWTDPPYGVKIAAKNEYLNSVGPSNRVTDPLSNDDLSNDDLLAMLRSALANVAAHCLPGAAFYVAAPAVSLHLLTGAALNELGIWHQTIQWVKNNATFSPSGVDYHWQAEPIFYGWLPNGAHRYHGGRKQTTVWEIDRPKASPEHPTMKPVALVERALMNSTLQGEIVADPFCGSGTTLIAAEQTDRIARVVELDPRYCDVIVARWETLTQRKATCRKRSRRRSA